MGEAEMQQQQTNTTFTNVKKPTSYELITRWIDVGYTLNLSPNALILMTTLLRFYNPSKKFVFPLQATLAQRTNTSLASVKRGLNELIKAHLILKRRTNRGNIYGFTGSLFELLHSANCTIPTAQIEPCMNEPNRRTNKEQHAGVVPLKKSLERAEEEATNESSTAVLTSSKAHLINEIPAIIKDNPQVKNPVAYWKSLKPSIRQEYLSKQAELDKKQEAYKAWLAEQEQIKEQEAKEAEAWHALPLEQQFSKETALSMVRLVTRGKKPIKEGSLTAQLVELYKIDISSMV